MAQDSGVGSNANYNKDSGKYVRQGHTSGDYGNDPYVASAPNAVPPEIKP